MRHRLNLALLALSMVGCNPHAAKTTASSGTANLGLTAATHSGPAAAAPSGTATSASAATGTLSTISGKGVSAPAVSGTAPAAAATSVSNASNAATTTAAGPSKAPAIISAASHPKRQHASATPGSSISPDDAGGNVPDDPYGLSVSTTATTIFASWGSDNIDTSGFLANIALGASAPFCDGGTDVGMVPETTFSNLEPNTEYTVSVCAYNLDGNLSDTIYAFVWTSQAPTPPGPPINVYVSAATTSSLTLDWAWNDATAINAYLSIAQGAYEVPCNSSGYTANVSEFTFDSLLSGTEYTISICNSSAGGLSSGVSVTAWTATPTPPAAPINVRISDATTTTLTVDWAWNDATATAAYLAIAQGTTPADCQGGSSATTSEAVLSGLLPNTQYTVSICNDNAGGFSSPVTVTATTPAACAATQATPAQVTGVVQSAASGTGIAAAAVRQQSGATTGATTQTDATGAYDLSFAQTAKLSSDDNRGHCQYAAPSYVLCSDAGSYLADCRFQTGATATLTFKLTPAATPPPSTSGAGTFFTDLPTLNYEIQGSLTQCSSTVTTSSSLFFLKSACRTWCADARFGNSPTNNSGTPFVSGFPTECGDGYSGSIAGGWTISNASVVECTCLR